MKTQTASTLIGLLLLTTISSLNGGDVREQVLSFDPAALRRAECGGTFRSDEGTLSFPGIPGESLIGGETCVWTIHLESTRDFRLNFTQFDVNSDDAGCYSAGVRLYSLSNLVPPGELQNELFCSGRLPSDSGFYLGGTVAALVVYSTSNNSDVGSGFTLTWMGASFDPFITKHVSSFSTIESGVVSYPVDGSYEPNLVATWAVATEGGRNSDVLIEKLEVEECPNSDPCTCDALILYEVEERGVLGESARFCANSSVSVERVGVADRFLLAFFTDFHESPEGTGFSAKYFPTGTTTSTPPSTTSPTTEPTTTSPPTTSTPTTSPTPPPEFSECGAVISEPSGYISYHTESNYSNFERCVWTLQVEYAAGYNFSVTEFDISDAKDGLLISPILSSRRGASPRNDNISNYQVFGINEEIIFHLGEVAILTFHSDASGTSRGFRIYYEAVRASFPDPRSGIIAQSPSRIDFPLSPNSNYGNYELATFVYSPNFKFDPSGDFANFAQYRKKELEQRCYDWLSVFVFAAPKGDSTFEWIPSPENSLICANVTEATYSHRDMLLFVFKSDPFTWEADQIGFELTFYTGPNNDNN